MKISLRQKENSAKELSFSLESHSVRM